jgi:hypothetical protein
MAKIGATGTTEEHWEAVLDWHRAADGPGVEPWCERNPFSAVREVLSYLHNWPEDSGWPDADERPY